MTSGEITGCWVVNPILHGSLFDQTFVDNSFAPWGLIFARPGRNFVTCTGAGVGESETLNSCFIVPKQWKSAIITPVEKINNPLGVTDFRPISVTSILSRKLEHIIVNKHIYPAMLDPPPQN